MSLEKTLKREVYLAPAFHIVIVLGLIYKSHMSRGTHSYMLAFAMKSISYTCPQSGKITAGIDGIPWGIHTTDRHMHSAKKSAVSTLQSLNIFGVFTQKCCMAYSKHGSECIPEGKQSGQLADLVLSLALGLHLK